MSVIEINRNRTVPMGAIATFQIVAFFERMAQALMARHNARATRSALETLSDRQLNDIGLRRGQIDAVAETLAHG